MAIIITASPAHQQRIFMYQDIQKFIKLLKYGELCVFVQNDGTYITNLLLKNGKILSKYFMLSYSSSCWFGHLSCQCSIKWSLYTAQFKVSGSSNTCCDR